LRFQSVNTRSPVGASDSPARLGQNVILPPEVALRTAGYSSNA